MSDSWTIWQDALTAGRIVAEIGHPLLVRARPGPVRDAFIATVTRTNGLFRLPPDADPAMLEPGVDLLASMAAGRTIERAGLVQRAGKHTVVIGGGERLSMLASSVLALAIDTAGLRRLIVFDESDDDTLPAMLVDRITMHVDLTCVSVHDIGERQGPAPDGEGVEDPVRLFCEAAEALGIVALRPVLHAQAIARASAVLDGRSGATTGDVSLAARLVLAPLAQSAPAKEISPQPPGSDEQVDHDQGDGGTADAERNIVLDAALAAIPADLLDRLATGPVRRGASGSAGGKGEGGGGGPRGRVRIGKSARGGRLDIAATLIAAAPFQRMRGRIDGAAPVMRRTDLRIRFPKPVTRALTVFAVDASGSAALARLAEVKGAVEQLLGQSYVRRDEVALVAFRGDEATLLLPATRSLARAKRELVALPGGGTTPLAAGLAAGLDQAMQGRRAGRASSLLVLSDGGANVSRDGTRGRAEAWADAELVARQIAACQVHAVVVDSSPRGDTRLRDVSRTMNARYVALPRFEDRALMTIAGTAGR